MALPAQVAVLGLVTATDHNALIPQIFHVREEQTSGTASGTFTSGAWQKRGLNTTALNEITGASMASSVVTLPAGVYNVFGWASALGVAAHKTRLRQTSGTPADLLIGSSEASATAATQPMSSFIRGRIPLSGSTTIELQHWCGTTRATNGFGAATGFGVNEVYSEIMFTKVG
jgi:hypothetical protein